MRVFVTGGTGLLGNTIIRQLCAAGEDVVALVRNEPPEEIFQGLEVELRHGDLVPQSPGEESSGEESPGEGEGDGSIEQAIADCDAVIHSAGKIHLGWTQLEQSMDVNLSGSRRVAEACRRFGKRMIHVGTVDTLAVGSPQTLVDETTPLGHAGGKIDCAYVKSKRAAVEMIRDQVTRGLDALIVHPGFMLGPWDWKPSSGRMMLEVGTGWKPVAPSGGCSLCDSRDVAAAVIRALGADAPSGREFILAGHNVTYLKLWTEMARRMGTRPPLRAAGPGIEYLAGLAGDLWTKVSGREPDFNSAGVAMSGQFHWYSSGRAESELGYKTRSAEVTLDDAAVWIRDRFVLPRSEVAS